MRTWFFTVMVIMLYVAVPFCAYQAWYFSAYEAEQVKSESLIMSSNPSAQQNEQYELMKNEKNTIDAEKIGFYCAAVMLFMIPTLMLVFRKRLLRN